MAESLDTDSVINYLQHFIARRGLPDDGRKFVGAERELRQGLQEPERKWRQVLHLADEFWRRWTREYLPPLRQRTKWQQPRRNVNRGDLVLITDKQLPRNEWSTGRVVDVIKGQDGLVRAAEVKTRAGTFLRPVVKLCVLEEVAFDQ